MVKHFLFTCLTLILFISVPYGAYAENKIIRNKTIRSATITAGNRLTVLKGGKTYNTNILDGGIEDVFYGGISQNATIRKGGKLWLASGNYFVVVESKDKGKGKYNTDYTLSVSKLQTLYPKIDNSDDTWKQASLLEGTEIEGNIEDWLGIGDAADYFRISLDPDSADTSYLAINLNEKTTQAVQDGILKFTCYSETGCSLALKELSPDQLAVKKALSGSEIYIGVSLKKPAEEVDYSFDTSLLASL